MTVSGMFRRARLAPAMLAALFAAVAQAQVLNFDACSTPTCPVGPLSEPYGISFSPSDNLLVVPANTSLLTGPVGGGKFLLFSGPTFQSTIALSRPATSFTLHLSRANQSASPLTVTLTLLRNGAIVESIDVVLEIVNQWTVVERWFFADGFDTLVLSPSGAMGNLSFGIDGLQFGGRCSGFSDVVSNDPYCSATEWLANRSVTLGCAAGQYCPAQGVTRAQMALFMQRLGDALSTVTIGRYSLETGDMSGAGRFDVCATDPLPAASWPRQAHISIALLLHPPIASTWRATPTVQPEGLSWDFTLGAGPANIVSLQADQYGTIHFQVDGVPIFPNRSYRFGAFLDRYQGSGGAGLIGCRVSVRIDNARRNLAPYDSASATGDGVTTVR